MNNKINNIPDDIIRLSEELNKYQYGYLVNGKIETDMESFFDNYKSLTIKDFEKYKVGVCWDYVHYEANWFKAHGYKYETFYVQVQDEDGYCPSHTFLVFYLPGSNKPYYFEASWKKYRGIENFNTLSELHKTIRQRHIDDAQSKCYPETYLIQKYDAASKSYEGISCKDYMMKASKGKVKFENCLSVEACKDVETARMFVRDVAKLAKKYNANYFIVTDGASGTSNNGNPAVKNARDAQIKWEKEHGLDPDEDWTNEASNITKNLIFLDISKNKQKCIKYLKQHKSKYTQHIDNYNGEIVVDTDKDLHVGQIFVGKTGKDEGFITGLWVRKEYRGTGLGKRLLNDAINKYNGIDLTVKKDNEVAVNMYRSHGFKELEYDDSDYYWMKLDESYVEEIEEKILVDSKDIYYNKDKFDSGEINLCFIIGHSGSGKSTMAREMADGDKIEYYELDDVVLNKISFTMENLKEYGDLIYSFFKGPGKKYYYTEEDRVSGKVKGIEGYYEEKLIKDFISYAISYAKSHKNKKYVLEGIWILNFIEPSLLKDYAVYIKGTSFIKSTFRAANREVKNTSVGDNRIKLWFDRATDLRIFVNLEKELKKYRKYFSSSNISESYKPLYPYTFPLTIEDHVEAPLLPAIYSFRSLLINEYEPIQGRIQIKESKKEDDKCYGLPKLKKYPMPDKNHVLSAIRFFNYVSPENEKELAKNIKKKMREYDISYSKVGDKNRLKQYIKEDTDILSEWCFDNFDTKPVLVFDLGSVLVEQKQSFTEALMKSKLIPNELAQNIHDHIINTFMDNSKYLDYCSSTDYYKFMTDKASSDIKKYIPTALRVNLDNMRKLPYTDSLIKQLKDKGYTLLYLSNWSKWSRDEYLHNTFDFLKYFDGGIFSCDVKLMKPDHKIYEALLKKFNIEGKQCIFFDDKYENIKASIECGMYGVLFNKDYTPQWIRDSLL